MFDFNKFKSVSVSEMQAAIGKALSELTGKEVDVVIGKIDFKHTGITSADFTVSASQRLEPFGETTDQS